MRQIMAAISWLNDEEQRLANVASHTTAHLAALVVAAASGGKCEPDPALFLPFLEQKLSAQVIHTIRELIKRQRLPMAVVAILADDIRHAIKQKEA
jgi:hypothetical protein